MKSGASCSEYLEFLALLTTAVANGLILKYCASSGASTSQILLWRGGTCLFITLALAARQRVSMWPVDPRFQMGRMALAGATLVFSAASYQYANASTVALISRLDIPILVAISPLLGISLSTPQRWISATTIAAVFLGAHAFRAPGEHLIGYILATAAVLSYVVSVLLVRRTAHTETRYMMMATPALACVVIAVAIKVFGINNDTISPCIAGLLSLSGVLMYWLYSLSFARFRKYSPARAEFPAVLVAIVLIPCETFLFGKEARTEYILSASVITGLVGYLVYNREPDHAK